MSRPLWKIAAPELGVAPMMTLEGSGIYITREDEGLVRTYSLRADEHHSRRQLALLPVKDWDRRLA